MLFSLLRKSTFRVIVIFCLVAILIVVLSFFIIKSLTDSQIKETLQFNLSSIQDLFTSRIKENKTILEFTALRPVTVQNALILRDRKMLLSALTEVKYVSGMDMLTITDTKGVVFLRAHNPAFCDDSILDDVFISNVIEKGISLSGISLVPYILFRASGDVSTELDASRKASYSGGGNGIIENKRMMIRAAVPIKNGNGVLIGILDGGYFVDGSKFTLTGIESNTDLKTLYKGNKVGFATLFHNDLYIGSTFNEMKSAQDVISTISDTVRNAVLADGKRWFAKTLIGNESYSTVFEPLNDVSGNRIGIVSVGLLDRKFIDVRKRMMLLFACIDFAILFAAFIITNRILDSTLIPIRKLTLEAQKLIGDDLKEQGQYEFESENEVGRLVKTFNYLISYLTTQKSKLTEMDEQVAESYRLAILGQLAAGVAHEINNPLGGITVYAHLLREDTSRDDPRFANIEKIIKESTRCKMIVKSLLDFSRQSKSLLEKTDIRKVVAEGLNNIRREAVFGAIAVRESYDENLPLVMADSSQIQEVCENIIRNAAEVMNGTGELTITCCSIGNDQARREVEILFEDSGPGISPEHIDRIFDPFYTTKLKGHGTGLGLAVSYGIVERHKGSLSVRNRKEGGAAFSVKLPVEG